MKKILFTIILFISALITNAQEIKSAIIVDDLIAPLAYNCQDIQEVYYQEVKPNIFVFWKPFGSFTDKDHAILIDGSKGTFKVPKQNTKVDLGHGEIHIKSTINAPIKDGVVKFKSINSFEVYINGKEVSKTNSTGMFAIYFDKQKFYDELNITY